MSIRVYNLSFFLQNELECAFFTVSFTHSKVASHKISITNTQYSVLSNFAKFSHLNQQITMQEDETYGFQQNLEPTTRHIRMIWLKETL